ncbi:prepilin-type N-terminal cleavage/methylation domain-containing protein [Blautia schinkii]|nr:prepilin-type N-terminal cleavage/methylation domain-containing protein [Blautia schinkii]
MKRSSRENKGFTLIELVIVVAVLAILVGLLAPSYTKYVKKSKVTKCEVQREEIEKAYQIACIEDSELASIVNTMGQNNLVINRLVELGYFKKEEAICPVYKADYTMVITTDAKKGTTLVEVQCPCVNNLLDYIGTANKVYDQTYKDKNSYNRQDLIEDFFNERGSLIEVDSKMKSNTSFSEKTLYWRPYTMKDGKVVLYASSGNDKTHASWKAYLIYVDGKIYQSKGINTNGKPDGLPMDSLYQYSGDEFEKWLANDSKGQRFELVKN